jgi:hypothetical protein
MKEFFTDLITLLFFIVALGLFWAAVTVAYSTVFINLVLVIISIFVLLQGCERLDKAYHLGEYNDEEEKQNYDEM